MTCLVRYTTVTATPAFWLYLYVAIFKELKDNGGKYIRALETIFDAAGVAFKRGENDETQ